MEENKLHLLGWLLIYELSHSIGILDTAIKRKKMQISTLLHRLDRMDAAKLKALPRVWWISIGSNEILQDSCSLDSVHAGIIQLIQHLLYPRFSPQETRQQTVVISSLVGDETLTVDEKSLIRLLNERLACTVQHINGDADDVSSNATNTTVEFFEVQSTQDDDDDFFVDVTYSASSKAQTVGQAAQVLAKISELI